MKRILFLGLALLALAGCATTDTRVVSQLDIKDFDFTDPALKQGRSCSTYILSSIGPFGNNDLIGAARDGNITKTVYVDTQAANYWLWRNVCTVIYGY